ncbi:Gfo/Idh/MocA family protein [Heyndrickxia vini]|uniref:Gfo/Idh/MocA family oxidoreductase n=1 Tax=Heyndrickxia vini TaxID=1476025 RepID=A0ABX7DXJ0_9BACI|nr:Gfo/Idh/MocA family oxidoreductase [Heyndrickxia vini]QQZ08161.1 Gfo/Idh/MocA family oxidoreductase [Heyndrickxia vini]
MRFATIGTNWITSTFIESARKSGKLTLKAVYSRSIDKAKDFAAKHSVPLYFNDITELAKHPEIDIVYIASPNSLHFDHAKLLLENNKHVICEKPIFSNIKEFTEAYTIANNHGVYLFEAIRNIHTPNINQLVKQLPKIGTIRSALLHYVQYSSRYDAFLDGDTPNVFSTEFSGGALVDLGVYPLSVAIKLFGKPVTYSYHPTILRSGVDGNGTLILQYNEFVCTIICSKISHSYIPSEIHGETGTIIMNSATPTSLELINNKTKERESISVNQEDLDMVYEIDAFTNIIENNDHHAYMKLIQFSETILSITETVRKQNNIIFQTDK